MTTKTCVGPCGRTLPAAAFGRNKQRKDGLHSYCIACARYLAKRVAHNAARGVTTTDLVDAEPARRHCMALVTAGMSRHQIAELAGVNRNQVRNLLVGQPHANQGPAKRIRRATERALLAVSAAPCAAAVVPEGRARQAGATVDSTGSRRRLEALMANGWPASDLSRLLGHAYPGLQLPRNRRCSSSTAAAVAALYDELSETPGPSQRCATLYRGRGYLHPGWWDPDTIDDPDAAPAGLIVEVQTVKGWPIELDLSSPFHDQVAVLARTGLSVGEIAQHLSVSRSTVNRARNKAVELDRPRTRRRVAA